jgi:hypothetical protein
MEGSAVLLPRHERARASSTNDPRRLRLDVDMRSVDGRRFADIFDALTLEFVDADPARIRDIAILRFAADKALAVGAFEDVVRLHNTIERKESRLRAVMKVKLLGRGSQPPEGLRNRLGSKYGGRARDSDDDGRAPSRQP